MTIVRLINSRMSSSIDFRINDLINEYLDYKGYRKTVEAFRDERKERNEPIDRVTTNGKSSTNEQIKVKGNQRRNECRR